MKNKAIPAGAGVALLAAALFGASTPLSKLLVGEVPPVLLAGLLYLGSGIGLFLGGTSHSSSSFPISILRSKRRKFLLLVY